MIFLTSNSNVDYMDQVMTHTLGKDWKKYFDLCVANARKPLFYRAEHPFYEYNPKVETRKGNKIKLEGIQKLVDKDIKMVIEGNALVLTEYFSRYIEKPDVKIAYFGDNALSDIHASNAFNERLEELEWPARWDSIAVIEEF